MEAAIGMFRGPVHVLVDGNEVFRQRVPAWAFGLPAREAFPNGWEDVHQKMDRVLATGQPEAVQIPTAHLLVSRHLVDGQPGVAVHAQLRTPLTPPPAHEPPILVGDLLEVR